MLYFNSSFRAALIAACLFTLGAPPAAAQSYAVEWSGGSVARLPNLPGVTNAEARGINNSGQAVGFSNVFASGLSGATMWSGGSVTQLPTFPGTIQALAFGVNNSGAMVGYNTVGDTNVATEWSGGAIVNLGRLPAAWGSVASGINDSGQIVGINRDSPDRPRCGCNFSRICRL